MDGPPLASLSLTHVHYDPSDPVSYLAAWLSLLPQCLCITYVTLLWATREAEVAMMFAGQMGCEALNFALKRLIKEERPRQMHGKGYGMPSSHAQFLFFFATYLALFLALRHRPRARPRPFPLPSQRMQARLVTGAVALVAVGVAASRVYLNYHTPRQVLAGVVAGVGFAGLWYLASGIARASGLLEWALDTPLARQFRVRDLVVGEDLVESGWKEWERVRAEARKKKG